MNKFAIILAIAACFVSTLLAQDGEIPSPESEIAASPESEIASSSESEISPSPTAPVLTAGEPMVINGSEDGDITVNGTILRNDKKLREKGSVHIELREDNGLYVNHKLVLQQNSDAPIITKNPKLKAKKVASFEIQIDDKGDVTYVVKTSK